MSIGSGRNNQPGLVPSLAWLCRYPKEWLRLDIVAGLTSAAAVIPKAMAYATIAGLPVHVGLCLPSHRTSIRRFTMRLTVA